MTSGFTEVQALNYQLLLNGAVIGQREVTIKYLGAPGQELRIVESYTDFEVPLPTGNFTYQQRLSGLGRGNGPTPFTSAIREDGRGREVQAVQHGQDWTVTVAEAGKANVYAWGSADFQLTSLNLVDPGSRWWLDPPTHLKVLVAETGQILSGPLTPTGKKMVEIGGQRLEGQAYNWQLETGPTELIYDPEGYLLRYTVKVAGQNLTAQLSQPPKPRTYGDDLGPLIKTGIQEQEL